MSDSTPVLLDPLQARVVAVLFEKEHTVPDTYPLSLNALVAGCNQKTSRDPVMSVDERQVQLALDALRAGSWVIESSGGRVMRYSHNLKRRLGVPSESVALLVGLMLRGPQTAGELRLNTERLQRFSDTSAMLGFLEELASWSPHPMVRLLPRQPGARESRWVHLLSGPPDEALLASSATAVSLSTSSGELDALLDRVATLEATVARLSEGLSRIHRELGLPDPDDASGSSTPAG